MIVRFPDDLAALFRGGYRLLFGLLPEPFREAHAPAMVAMLADRHRDTRASSGVLAEWLLFLREGKDLVATTVRLRKERTLTAGEPGGEGPVRTWLRDVGHAWRGVIRRPAVPAVIVATLALAIGATTAIYSVLDAALLRPLPYPSPERLLAVNATIRTASGETESAPLSYPKLEVFRRNAQEFAAIAGYASRGYNLTGGDRPQRLNVELVTPSYFTLLGGAPRLGRLLVPADTAESAIAVLSEALWRSTFAADPNIVGRSVLLDAHRLTVVGVAPLRFRGLSGPTDLWVPLPMAKVLDYPEALTEAYNHWIGVVARMPTRMSMGEAAVVADRAGIAAGEVYPSRNGPALGATVQPLDGLRAGPDLVRSLWILLAAMTGILLIACGNIAGLLLARAEAARHAFAIRLAIGATRGHLARQLVMESVLLAALGGALGVALAAGLVEGLTALAPTALRGLATDLFSFETVRLDLRVLGFAAALTAVAGLGFGLWPAVRASGQPLAELLAGARRATTGAPGRFRPGRWLIAGQVMAAVVLLVGAGLLLKSFYRLQSQPLGFELDRMMTFRLQPVFRNTREEAPRFNGALVDRLNAVPGVRRVTLATCAPFAGACSSSIVGAVDGRELQIDQAPVIGVHYVGPEYFRTMGIPLVAGRDLARSDEAGSPRVVVVNRSAAERLWPGESPVGKRLSVYVGFFRDGDAEVIGVAEDVRFGTPSDPAMPDVFIPSLQGGFSWTIVLARTELPPAAVMPDLRRAVADLDPDAPVYDVRTLSERLGEAVARPRYAALLLAGLAGVALLLAATGLYGVLAFRVGRRRHEFGVRMALGAEPGNILRGVLREATLVTVAGLAAGLAIAVAGSRVLEGLLYGVGRSDPWVLATVPVVLIGVNLLAALLPALRATRVDPMSVLKAE